MPYYTPRRASDNTKHGPISARDDAHAVAVFSTDLGISLTLEEGLVVAPYMMVRNENQEGATWRKVPDIAVWVRDPNLPE